MSISTDKTENFEYHMEDVDCRYCQYYMPRTRRNRHGCREETCRFEEVRREAISGGKIKRSPKWFKRHE